MHVTRAQAARRSAKNTLDVITVITLYSNTFLHLDSFTVLPYSALISKIAFLP